jgi:hypothetical protein
LIIANIPGRHDSGGRTPAGPAPKPTGGATPGPTGPGTGQNHRDGQLEFTVSSLRCGVDKLGSGLVTRRPDGQYCLVGVSAHNVGSATRTLLNDRQYMYDAAGGQHGADFWARFFFRSENIWNPIDPGETVHGTLVFDIPAGSRPQRLELHDGLLSGGVTIPL